MAVTANNHKPSPSPLGCQALSPRVQFRLQPAEALEAPGEQGRCDGSPAAAGGALELARGARGSGGLGSRGKMEQRLHKPLGSRSWTLGNSRLEQQAGTAGWNGRGEHKSWVADEMYPDGKPPGGPGSQGKHGYSVAKA